MSTPEKMGNTMTIRFKPALLAAAIGLAGVAAAHADTMVTVWDYNVSGIWSDAQFSSGTGTHGIFGNTLRWGTPSNPSNLQSSLTIGNNPAIGQVTTGDSGIPSSIVFAPALSLTHANNVLAGGSATLTMAQLTATLTLTPNQPVAGPAQTPPAIQYDIKFVETTNATPCPSPSPAGNPCNDIFVQVTGAMNQTFDYDGYTYYLNILPLDGSVLSVLGDGACQAAGAPKNCVGFTTEEGKNTTLRFGFSITTTPVTIDVPEPGMLALLGLGLGVAGFAGRRRKAA